MVVEEHKRLYEEALVKEIMQSTALYVQELLSEEPDIDEDNLCNWIEENFRQIIEETLADDDEDISQGNSFS